MNQTKEDLLKQLRDLEEKEQRDRKEEEKQKNYEKFKNRKDDWVIGKAHCDIGKQQIDYHWTNREHTLGQCVSISGNCRHSYDAQAFVTVATHTFFHNVWTENQRRKFQEKLNKVAFQEVQKIMGSLRCVLEIMGLQSSNFYLKTLYPDNKIEEMKKEIWEETCTVLDKYSDDEFKKLLVKRHWWNTETDESGERSELDLSHSRSIVKRYVMEKRKHLIKYFGFDKQ
jgi:hypothetical protein